MPRRLAALLILCLCGRMAGAQEPPLRAGILANTPPFVIPDQHGAPEGFVPALFRAIAARLQREIVFTSYPENGLLPALDQNEVDLLPGPINATPDRAAHMLLTEGYVWSMFQFGAPGAHPIESLADLRGRRLAVHENSLYGEWAQRNAGRYGFTILNMASAMDAARAVSDGKADASLAGSPTQEYAAFHMTGFSAGLALPETRTHESAAVRRGDVELRDELEDALRCLKLNGTVARLSRQWLGREPDAEDLENLVVPGYGVPGLSGYDPKPRKAGC